MYEKLTATLDETFTRVGGGQRMGAVRRYEFQVVPPIECDHESGNTICKLCAGNWQADYQFGDDFPFERVLRLRILALIYIGKINVGDVIYHGEPGSQVTAVVTGTGGIMLPDGRVYGSPAAATRALARGSEDPFLTIMPN